MHQRKGRERIGRDTRKEGRKKEEMRQRAMVLFLHIKIGEVVIRAMVFATVLEKEHPSSKQENQGQAHMKVRKTTFSRVEKNTNR